MMRYCLRFALFSVLLCLCVCIVSCEKKKPEGKVEVTAQEFILRQDKENSYLIDAKGKITNTGPVDVKNVVVTGYCRSCGEEWIPGRWFVGAEKVPEQKAVISHLPAGGEADFSFKEIADILLASGSSAAPTMPENLEVVVESFEVVEK